MYVPAFFVTFICAPVPTPPWNTVCTADAVPVPVNAVPDIDAVKISPPVSTLSTKIVASLAGVAPPKSVPLIMIASPTA